jgi:hypothetical protein
MSSMLDASFFYSGSMPSYSEIYATRTGSIVRKPQIVVHALYLVYPFISMRLKA